MSLNTNVLRTYAKQFASTTCEQFYARNVTAQGNQLPQLTPSKQVNFFVIWRLFQLWQEETLRLRSPYFNYEASEVKEALTQFMNTLSRHMEIKREALEPLVIYGVEQTLTLALTPEAFYQELFKSFGEDINPETELKPTLKYIKLHENLRNHVYQSLSEHAQGGVLSTARAVSLLQHLMGSGLALEDSAAVFTALSRVVPISQEQLSRPAAPKSTSFFDDALADEIPLHSTASKPQKQTPPAPPAPKAPAKEVAAEAEVHRPPTPPAEPEPPTPEATEEEANPNDYRKPFFEKTPVQSLHELIPVSKKYRFAEELFQGDKDELESAISKLDRCADYQEAMQVIKQNYMRPLGWAFDKDEVKEFFEYVSLRF